MNRELKEKLIVAADINYERYTLLLNRGLDELTKFEDKMDLLDACIIRFQQLLKETNERKEVLMSNHLGDE